VSGLREARGMDRSNRKIRRMHKPIMAGVLLTNQVSLSIFLAYAHISGLPVIIGLTVTLALVWLFY